MLIKNNKLRLAVVYILLSIATISTCVLIKDKLDEQESLKKQEQLQSIYNQDSASDTLQLPNDGNIPRPFAKTAFADLIDINHDLIGWLDMGEISLPVVQTGDNSTYLVTDFYGNKDPHGTIFMDMRNASDASDDNTILYGHNYKKSEQLFYEVEKYKEPQYAAKYPIITLTTLYEKHEYVVFASFIANTNPALGDTFDYHNQIYFSTTEQKQKFIDEIQERSLIISDVKVNADDDLLMLSTCGYDFDGQRIVTVARRLRNEEQKLEIRPTPIYSKAENPLLPEIWMKLYGQKS